MVRAATGKGERRVPLAGPVSRIAGGSYQCAVISSVGRRPLGRSETSVDFVQPRASATAFYLVLDVPDGAGGRSTTHRLVDDGQTRWERQTHDRGCDFVQHDLPMSWARSCYFLRDRVDAPYLALYQWLSPPAWP
jgi:hypothetical protein